MFFEKIKERRLARKRFWESLCKKCGQCCYEKQLVHGRVYVKPDAPCPYLDTETRQCTVYDQRFRVCPECRKVTWWHARFCSWMPSTCGYVRYFRGRAMRRTLRPLRRPGQLSPPR